MAEQILMARNGALFVQTDGPNTKPEYVSCVDVDAIAEPGGGIDTLIRCFRADGQGWETIAATLTPPDPVTTTITALATATQSFLELIKTCPATFFLMQRETGRADSFTNYVRATILGNAYINDRGVENAVMRETDGESTLTFGLTAFPPLSRVFKKATSRQSVALPNAANAITYLNDIRCASGSSPAQGACKIGFISGDGATGSPSATADVYYTTNYGQTWAATAADPFAAGEIIGAITVFSVGANTRRVMVARGTTDAAAAAEIAYSDNDGTTWSQVTVGSTLALYALGPNALFALDQNNIWLVTGSGFVHYSEDGGVTWTTQDAGVATSQNLLAVHFADNKVGFAGGAADDVIRTIDGGVSWSAVTDVGATSTVNTIFALDAQRAWVGTANGRLYYTEDAGTTWTRRTFLGDSVGAVKDIRFVNSLVGFMVHDTAAPVGRIFTTMDGGYSWELVTTVTNAGLNNIAVCDENNFFVAGEVVSGTAMLVKVQPAA